MTTNQYIISFLELAAVVGVIIALFNEQRIAQLEKRFFQKIKKLWEVIR